MRPANDARAYLMAPSWDCVSLCSRTTLHRGKEHTFTNTVPYPPDTHVRALRCFTGPKGIFRSLWRPKIRSTALSV
jgi:hypothetical protein